MVGEFSLVLPPGLELAPSKGADSLYRQYESETLVVSMDYGWYSNSLSNVSGTDLKRKSIAVDGRAAVLVTYRELEAASGLSHVVALHVPDVGRGQVKLTIIAQAAGERARTHAERIVHSLRFIPQPDPADPLPDTSSLTLPTGGVHHTGRNS